jgi:hypothetical protein
MAKYKLTAAAIINDRQYEIGEEVEFDGVPGPHMEPLDADAKKAVADFAKREVPALDPDKLAYREERNIPGRSEEKERANELERKVAEERSTSSSDRQTGGPRRG